MSPTGIRTMPLQPAFFAYVTSTIPAVTGDGTGYQVIYDSTKFNIQNGYNASTGSFTAPVSGIYHFTASVYWLNVTPSHTTGSINIATTAYGPVSGFTGNPASIRNASNAESSTVAATVQMAAGETASVTTIVLGGTKVISIAGTALNGVFISTFTGALLF